MTRSRLSTLPLPSFAAVATRLRSVLRDAPISPAVHGDSADPDVLPASAVVLSHLVTPPRSPSQGVWESERRTNLAQLQVLQYLLWDRGITLPLTVEEALKSAAAWCLSSVNSATELGRLKVSLASVKLALKACMESVVALREELTRAQSSETEMRWEFSYALQVCVGHAWAYSEAAAQVLLKLQDTFGSVGPASRAGAAAGRSERPESSPSTSIGPESVLPSATTQIGTKHLAGGEASAAAKKRMPSTG